MVYRHTGVGTDGVNVIVWRFSQRQRMCIWIALRQSSVYEDFGEDVHTAMAIMMMELIWAINGIPSYRCWNRCVYGNNMEIFAAAEDVYLDSVQAKEFGEDVHIAMAIMMMELIWAINGIPSYRSWNRCVYGNNMEIFAAAEDVYLDSVQAKQRL